MRPAPRGTGRRPLRALPRRLGGPLVRCALALGLLAGPAACGSGPDPGRVTILVPWEEGEFRAFYAVVEQYEKDHGIQVDMEYTRAQTQQLDAVIAAGAPPDLAVLPSPAALYKYAGAGGEKALRPLDASLTAGYLEPFRGLATVDGTVYAVPVKADVKSLNWYAPGHGPKPAPSPTPAGESGGKGAAAFCLGLASGPTSGWPGADWITDILLSGGGGPSGTPAGSEGAGSGGTGSEDAASGARGIDAYLGLLSGDVPWADTEHAWRLWRQAVAGSVDGASGRAPKSLYRQLTADPPECTGAHGALSALGFPPYGPVRPGHRPPYDFVPSAAPGGRLQVSADFVGLFTDNPAALALLTHLATPAAQRSWANQPGGYALSANSAVRTGDYTADPVQGRLAAKLRPESGYRLCFSAADVMQPDVSAAFYRAVLDYAAKPEKLAQLLPGLDEIQRDRGDTPVPLDRLCTGGAPTG